MTEHVKLGEVCTVISGTTPKSSEPIFWGGPHQWVTPAEIDEDTYIVTHTERTLTDAGVGSKHLPLIPAGTVLLTSRAPIGKVAIAGCNMYCNQGFKNLVCSDRIDNEYLYRFLKSNTRMLQNAGHGATFKELSKKDVEHIDIPLPDMNEQRRIANRLDEIERLQRIAKDMLSKYDELIQSRFDEMFGDPILNSRGWEISSIRDTSLTYGDGPFGSNLKSSDYVDDGVRVIRLGNVGVGHFMENDKSFIALEHYQKLKEYSCESGEVVIATMGDPNLRACLVPDFDMPAIHKADCMYYETNKNCVLPVFAMWVINHPTMLQRALQDAHGQTRSRINGTQVGRLPMIMPPLSLQQQFATFAEQANRMRNKTAATLERLQTLYDSLAQEYFAI